MTRIIRRGMSPYDRVMDQVERRLVVPELGPCLVFTGYCFPTGYGSVATRGIPDYAHRIVAREIWGEPPPDKPFVLHACDNPPCVEITHLSFGTHAENMEQARRRRRTRIGTKHWHHKLTDEQVLAIYADPRPAYIVADDFSVQAAAIRKIKNGERWAWLTGHQNREKGVSA